MAALTTAPAQGPVFLFNTNPPATDAELRAGLPPRSKIEKLVSRFFNSLDPAIQILHYRTFHDRMDAFFADPSSQSTAWIGLLYATLTLAMQSYSRVGDEPPEWKGEPIDFYLFADLIFVGWLSLISYIYRDF